MKKAILLSFLFLIFSCSNDDDLVPKSGNTAMENSSVKLIISQSDDTTHYSCPEVGESSFLIKDNSLISGALGQYGRLVDSYGNIIVLFSCTGNDNIIVQRFGGILSTINGETVNLEGRLVIDRWTQQVGGAITINIINSNDSKTYDVIGSINKSGSCEIESYPQRK